MVNLSALLVLIACLPCFLSFSPAFRISFQIKSTVTSMSSGIPDFSQEPQDPQRCASICFCSRVCDPCAAELAIECHEGCNMRDEIDLKSPVAAVFRIL